MKKHFRKFPEPQKLKNYEFLRFLGSNILNNNYFLLFFSKRKRSPKMLKRQFKHIKQQKTKKTSKNVKKTDKQIQITKKITKI